MCFSDPNTVQLRNQSASNVSTPQSVSETSVDD